MGKWSTLTFGKHNGKSLPQVLFKDPDWFFWAVEKRILKGQLADEAEILRKRARRIRIPGSKASRLVAEYTWHPSGGFEVLEIVPVDRPVHHHSARRAHIDMEFVREMNGGKMDKTGYREFIRAMKQYLFGSENRRMTKKRCEEFFEKVDNFDV